MEGDGPGLGSLGEVLREKGIHVRIGLVQILDNGQTLCQRVAVHHQGGHLLQRVHSHKLTGILKMLLFPGRFVGYQFLWL